MTISTPIFDGLPEETVQKIGKCGRKTTLGSEEYLFTQHAIADYVYVVNAGSLLIERISPAGRRQVLWFLSPANFVGFTHYLYYDYSVVSLSQAEVTGYSRKQFVQWCEEIPRLKQNVDKLSAEVMMRLFDQIFALGQKNAQERLCFFLKQRWDRQTNPNNEITLSMKRQDIADFLGLTLETVSRSFAKLKQEKIIDVCGPRRIKIINIEELSARAFLV